MAAEQDDFYRNLLNSLTEGVYFTDRERRVIFWNNAAERITGFKKEEVLGRCCADNILMHVDASGCQLCVNGCPLSATMADGQQRECEVFLRHKDGHRVAVHVRAAPVTGGSGEIVGAVEVFSINTLKAQMAERLREMERLALLDSLTGLGNRRYLESQIQARIEELRRNHWPFGVLFIDIDHFKQFNDRFGHEIGDRVLKMVGLTLDENSRFFDSVGRWGGEEFLAILANTNEDRLREIAERFRALVARSELSDIKVPQVTVSIGGTMAVSDDSPECLLRRADEKLYLAKSTGRNRVCL